MFLEVISIVSQFNFKFFFFKKIVTAFWIQLLYVVVPVWFACGDPATWCLRLIVPDKVVPYSLRYGSVTVYTIDGL